MLHGEAKKKRESKHNLYKRVVQNTCLGWFLLYSRLQGEVKSWGQHFSPSQTLFVLDVSAALTQSFPTLCDAMNCSSSGSQFSRQEYWSGLLCPSPGIFPIQGSNPGLPHCGQIFFFFNCLSYQESPWILEWVAYPISRGSSPARTWTGIACIAGEFFTQLSYHKSTIQSSQRNEPFHFHLPAYFVSWFHCELVCIA